MENVHGARERSVAVDPKPDTGVHRDARAISGDELFGLDVQALSDFII